MEIGDEVRVGGIAYYTLFRLRHYLRKYRLDVNVMNNLMINLFIFKDTLSLVHLI